MLELDYNTMSKVEVDATKECIDLCNNGYVVMWSSHGRNGWTVKLRHRRNGSQIHVAVTGSQYMILRGGVVKKLVQY